MLTLFKKFFGPSPARAIAPPSTPPPLAEPLAPMQSLEVANLSLAAILERLPEEFKQMVLKQPEPTATVALPIATILKQLPGGAVKVSLATVHRQAPAGVLGPLPPGDKRMVEVPLAEVFRHVKPTMFKRRHDQRSAAALDSKFSLFGDTQNPYQLAPTAPEDEVEVAGPAPLLPTPRAMMPAAPAAPAPSSRPLEFKLAVEPAPVPSVPRVLAPPPEILEPKLRQLPVNPAPTIIAPPVEPAPVRSVPLASPAPVAAPVPQRPSISVPVEPLCSGWPEPIRQVLAVLNGSAFVALPTDAVNAGLARGKVTFTWGEIRSWIQPAVGAPSVADEATELTLPLKVVAPIFLAASKKPAAEQRPVEFDAEIPMLFADARAAVVVEEAPAAPEVTAIPEVIEPPVEVAAPAPLTFTIVEEAPPAEPAVEAPAPEPPVPTTVGDVFGQPEKTEWTPAEIVANLAKLAGVTGAVVALQEGLLVAHSMPGDVKSEVIAAFLPQLFARLNQYAGEMKLGDVDDLLFTTHGAHCQIYRLGYVYFAVLGKPGEPLPWAELRLVADELARQTQKA